MDDKENENSYQENSGQDNQPVKIPDAGGYTPNSEQLNSLTINNNPAKEFLSFIFDLLKTGVIVFAVAFALRYFAVQPFIVEGESMLPNFVNNEYLLAEKISYLIGQPQRGDVVVFRYPKDPSVNYIKRIIGLPGETVKIETNKIIVVNAEFPDGLILSEDYIPKDYLTMPLKPGTIQSVTLGSNEFFVLGDNRQHSSDSREWGILPKENIAGRAWLTLLPFDRFGLQHKKSYEVSF